MAGDWIPVSVEIHGKPEIARLAAALDKTIDECVGIVLRFWAWAQIHTADGFIRGLDLKSASAASGVDVQFLQAMQTVGWLELMESGLRLPHFDRWFGGAAKRRLQDREKKRRQRSQQPDSPPSTTECVPNMSRSCPDAVPQLSRAHRDKSGTREEKSIEYRSNTPPIIPPKNRSGTDQPPSPPDQSQPDGCSSAEADGVRADPDQLAFSEWWVAYPRKVGKKAAQTAYVKARRRICRETGCTPAEARERLLEAARAFSESPKGRGQYCPHPSRWLNDGRWEDDRAEWQRAEAAGNGAKQVDPFA